MNKRHTMCAIECVSINQPNSVLCYILRSCCCQLDQSRFISVAPLVNKSICDRMFPGSMYNVIHRC
ncbi:hypothetical protein SCLCIDRAFT_597271 [Scleroderma citrinum Foug A]|uniref:Uncharacterized protein n=1 Tax=Scleroderma citrinum Foug A TaxID=1036808 RepID=A0A0C3EA25_9AGAM|nr:hypothetical protein SCLCIDRAFT_597271 [Scleroderma citrinum Foug A]